MLRTVLGKYLFYRELVLCLYSSKFPVLYMYKLTGKEVWSSHICLSDILQTFQHIVFHSVNFFETIYNVSKEIAFFKYLMVLPRTTRIRVVSGTENRGFYVSNRGGAET